MSRSTSHRSYQKAGEVVDFTGYRLAKFAREFVKTHGIDSDDAVGLVREVYDIVVKEGWTEKTQRLVSAHFEMFLILHSEAVGCCLSELTAFTLGESDSPEDRFTFHAVSDIH